MNSARQTLFFFEGSTATELLKCDMPRPLDQRSPSLAISTKATSLHFWTFGSRVLDYKVSLHGQQRQFILTRPHRVHPKRGSSQAS
ncbi:hypothetical protein VN97_g3333 [Penicillium thymicola]|uniref:Uncharacterized protein n=1 Tax=Penicillium thymicola TaxID=293382 RepID=A0AAI9TMM2_PENTH|nr:hypothetical protein VN97_g3333 [Penicillium thymicola]